MPQKILVVDDDPEMHELISFALKRHGYDVVSAHDAFEGLRVLAETSVDLAMLDIMMPNMDGLEMLSTLRPDHPNLRVIMMTAISTPEAAVSALRDQACDFLAKPFDIGDLISAVDTALSMSPREIKIEVMSARPEWIELKVPCSDAAVEPLERLMAQLKTDLPRTTRESVSLAFREMLRNAIEHGGHSDPSKFVAVAYLRTPRIIIYRIKDPGSGFVVESLHHSAILNPQDDPTHHVRVREEKGMRAGGFGILIARNMVDEMVYNEQHNEVVLIKYLDAEE